MCFLHHDYSLAYKLGGELAEDPRGPMRPPCLAVAVRQGRGRGPTGVSGALLVAGAPLLARVERAADDSASGEVGSVRHGRAADVVGRWGGARRPLLHGTAGGRRREGGGGGERGAIREEEVKGELKKKKQVRKTLNPLYFWF